MSKEIFYLIHNFAGRWNELDAWMIFFSDYLQYWMVAGVLVYVFFGKGADRRKNQLMVFAAAISAIISRGVITEIIRLFYHRPRPFVAENFLSLINHEVSGSFPSGHMTLWWAVTAAVYFYNKKLALALALASLVMGVARIYVGVHWPSDILGGIIVGLASFWVVKLLLKKYLPSDQIQEQKLPD